MVSISGCKTGACNIHPSLFLQKKRIALAIWQVCYIKIRKKFIYGMCNLYVWENPAKLHRKNLSNLFRAKIREKARAQSSSRKLYGFDGHADRHPVRVTEHHLLQHAGGHACPHRVPARGRPQPPSTPRQAALGPTTWERPAWTFNPLPPSHPSNFPQFIFVMWLRT